MKRSSVFGIASLINGAWALSNIPGLIRGTYSEYAMTFFLGFWAFWTVKYVNELRAGG